MMDLKGNDRGDYGMGLGKHTKILDWVAAEKEVTRLLATFLLDGWLVLNDVPFPYGNLDHLVIRPDGAVFLIETKSHRSRVTWDGKQLLINKRPFTTNPICQVNRSIRWLRHMAKWLFGKNPWVVAILTFPNARVSIRRSIKRVNVMPTRRLVSFIRNYPTAPGRTRGGTASRMHRRSGMPIHR